MLNLVVAHIIDGFFEPDASQLAVDSEFEIGTGFLAASQSAADTSPRGHDQDIRSRAFSGSASPAPPLARRVSVVRDISTSFGDLQPPAGLHHVSPNSMRAVSETE